MLRLILCGAVAASLAALLITFTSSGSGQTEPGIKLAPAGQTEPAQAEVAAEHVESLDDSNKSLAQIWLVAFGAGAFFLLELVSPLGIFYGGSERSSVGRAAVPRFPATERLPVRQRRLSASAS